ncbi:hypothetical protein GQ457_01G002970 [Hibiscus cannabinus]
MSSTLARHLVFKKLPQPIWQGNHQVNFDLFNFFPWASSINRGLPPPHFLTSVLRNTIDELKQGMVSEPVLVLPDHTRPFEIYTDASDVAIGGVLMQEGHPVAFESRKLNETERRYTVHEKEMTAVVHCLRTWRHHVLGSRFVVYTDNVANVLGSKLSPKQARWQEFLAEFDFTMEYKPGKVNFVADALSRWYDIEFFSMPKGSLWDRIKEGLEGSWELAEDLWQFKQQVKGFHSSQATRASLDPVGENVTDRTLGDLGVISSAPQGATQTHQEHQHATSTHGAPQGALHAHQPAKTQVAAREAICSVLGLHHVIHPGPSLGFQETSTTDMVRESPSQL